VDLNPSGTVFVLRSGVHRLQTVVPKSGNAFYGEAGAVMSGARLLTSFTREGSYWVATGQTQQGPVVGVCKPTSPRCSSPEELFIDNVRLRHVASLSAVGPGAWFFDYAADKIYIGEDPTGRAVETSVNRYAFHGPATNVTIEGLVIEKYANPAQQGAVFGYSSRDWVVARNLVRWNHGGGIQTGHGMKVQGNVVINNGQLGISGSGDNVLVEDNEIAFNNVSGFDWFWEAGGSKWVKTNGLVVRRNFSHHNHGQGLWTDIDNINVLYENNTVEDNELGGIFHEISYRATIRGNIARRNGTACSDWCGAGIIIASSSDVEVTQNIISDNKEGIYALHENRGSGAYGTYRLQNLYVHHNTITMAVGYTGIAQWIGDPSVYTSMNNRFEANTYYLGPNAQYFFWQTAPRSEAQWRAYGNDVTGVFTR
jgi:parallel beta-helix repeat protein